jgi:hypothetical protein
MIDCVKTLFNRTRPTINGPDVFFDERLVGGELAANDG